MYWRGRKWWSSCLFTWFIYCFTTISGWGRKIRGCRHDFKYSERVNMFTVTASYWSSASESFVLFIWKTQIAEHWLCRGQLNCDVVINRWIHRTSVLSAVEIQCSLVDRLHSSDTINSSRVDNNSSSYHWPFFFFFLIFFSINSHLSASSLNWPIKLPCQCIGRALDCSC